MIFTWERRQCTQSVEVFSFSNCFLEGKRLSQFPDAMLRVKAGTVRSLRMRLENTYADICLVGVASQYAAEKEESDCAGKEDAECARNAAYLAGDLIRLVSRSCTDTEIEELSVCIDLPGNLKGKPDWVRIFFCICFSRNILSSVIKTHRKLCPAGIFFPSRILRECV